ncbi:MAG TPA: glycine betaine/L-proline ABC transporter ATP-binding protein [Balneolales bacterium]|nr:glycine betaine/L-proline ABC transporter ATP-binding protein [Balneolales bacterium]
MGIITVKNLYKIFGTRKESAFKMLKKGASKDEILDKTDCTVAINNASFEIHEQEIFVIMGLSGSGKSTVLRCLNRLIEPTKGEVLINGEDILKADKEELIKIRRSHMSMVFQHFGLFPHRTVSSNVEYGLEISGMDKKERQDRAYKALHRVGLKGYEESMPDELSGGMQQRVGLARALANDPDVLLMDEAFSALDPLIRTQMQDELLELQAEMHKTIVFITHDLDEALKLGDRIAIMKDGAVVQIGTPEEILTNPSGDYVRSFVQNVDRTKVITASTIMRKPPTISIPKDGPRVAARKMEQIGVSTLYVIDKDRKLKGVVRIDDVIELQKKNSKDMESIVFKDVTITTPETPLSDLLAPALMKQWPIAVLNDDGKLVGIVDRASIIAEVGDNYGNNSSATNDLEDYDTFESSTKEEVKE